MNHEELLVLTPREEGVMNLLRRGVTRKLASDYLGVAEDTVISHIKSVFAKLGVHNTAGALARLEELRVERLRSELQYLCIDAITEGKELVRLAAVDAILAHIGDENVTFLMRSLMIP